MGFFASFDEDKSGKVKKQSSNDFSSPFLLTIPYLIYSSE